MRYVRPLVQIGPERPLDAEHLAGGWGWFSHVEILSRGAQPAVASASVLTAAERDALVAPRAPIAGLTLSAPRIMGIVNTTPDSFSDGGTHAALDDAVTGGLSMIKNGAHLLDIGGESTRPGAEEVAEDEEVRRTAPVIKALRDRGADVPISIDTRKTAVAAAALAAGADLINDVSGFTFDPALAPLAAKHGAPVCVMHSRGTPETMQGEAVYGDVLLDVYDDLARQIAALEAAGVPKSRILADPGIGFAKTLEHNITLLARLSLFHSLGVGILLGASRKRFIGTIGQAPDPQSRAPGSIAVALAGLEHAVQMLRVHDVCEMVQAAALWQASRTGRF